MPNSNKRRQLCEHKHLLSFSYKFTTESFQSVIFCVVLILEITICLERRGLEWGRQEMTPAEKINTNIFPFSSSFYFTLISREIRHCKIVSNYMTITVHLPWVSRVVVEPHEFPLVSLIHSVVWILTRWEELCLLGIRDSTPNCVTNS